MGYASSYAAAPQRRRKAKAKSRPKARARASAKSGRSRGSRISRARARATTGASKAKAAGATKRRAPAKRVTYVYRYNPSSSSGRAVRVRSDSPEALDWPTRRPIGATAAGKHAIQAAERVVPKVLPVAAAGAIAGAKKVARAVAPIAKTALVAAIGAAAYTATRYVIDQYQSGAADPAYIVSMAALHARREAQVRLGRTLTADEIKQLREKIAQTYAMQQEVTRGAVPLGLGPLVNLLMRAL